METIEKWKASPSDDVVIAECARSVRNLCATQPDSRRDLFASTEIFQLAKHVLETNETVNDEPKLVAMRCTLQMLFNLCNGLDDVIAEMWSQLQPNLEACAEVEDAKTSNYVSAVVSLVLGVDSLTKEFVEGCSVFVRMCNRALMKENNEHAQYSFLLLKKLFTRVNVMKVVYEDLPMQEKLFLLDFITECVKDDDSVESGADVPVASVSIENVTEAAAHFRLAADNLLTVMNTGKDLDPSEVMRLLELLCSTSALQRFRPRLQEDKSLLISSVYLLRMVHEVGSKEKDSIFTPIRKMAQMTEDTPTDHAVGFKTDLIRLIANLAWKNKVVQDEVRENQGLQVILDCSPMDANNPFIMQWVILAIRNLCEDNAENQAVLAQLEQKGTINTRILVETGIPLNQFSKLKL